ncbi:MAG: alpha/beta fold hydrolase [bacterium]|nr:alpha/beta fold hydrolase [bacterium]
MSRRSHIKRKAVLLIALAQAAIHLGCAGQTPPGLMGAYVLEDGRLISIRKSTDDTLRARVYSSGESRRLYPEKGLHYISGPGFAVKSPEELVVEFELDETGAASRLTWEESGMPALSGRRLGRAEDVELRSGEVTLGGRLDLPESPGPHPAIVLVHGSGDDAATDFYCYGDFFAAHGIATLTFDKRGTGRSEGIYTFDFHQLARDVVAAVDYLRSRSDVDGRRIGLSGYSQGAWVAPLAASMTTDLRYVIVNYGLIASPAEEARVETRNELRRRGVDEESLEQVDELTLAAVKVVSTGFRDGWAEFREIEERYRHEPWMDQLSGTVGKFVRYPRWAIELIGPRTAPRDMPWYYDSTELLTRLDVPMVWLLAEADESAPIELTRPALERLRAAGKPYELTVYPDADHTMLLFTEKDGERIYTGYVPGYFTAMVEAARRHSGGAAGLGRAQAIN